MNQSLKNAVWLYGSHARGDCDTSSDMDVLIVGDTDVPEKELLEQNIFNQKNLSVSRYSWKEIVEMAGYGSLYLQHIRLEGKPIRETMSCEGDLAKLLSEMGEYKNIKKDLIGFDVVLQDIERSATYSPRNFELSVLAMVLRHICILGCWQIGTPVFTRYGPISTLAKHFKLNPVIVSEFNTLYEFRLYSAGLVGNKTLSKECSVLDWVMRARGILDLLKGNVYDKN